MPLFGRIGRPGLLGTAARTAVIAGTATATAGAIRRHQYNRAQEDYESEQYELAQQQAAQASAAGGVPPTPAGAPYNSGPAAGGVQPGPTGAAQADRGGPADTDLVAQLSRLASLHTQGALTDEEFAAAKAKLVG